MSGVAVIGGGPAGLMAAERAAAAGLAVDIYERMPSVGRKFLMAGKGGLNLTHSEPMAAFAGRYGVARERIGDLISVFGPEEIRKWVRGLGIETFVGSSGRIFPAEMKAAPLLRAWVRRLRGAGVRFHTRHHWLGWNGDALHFETPEGLVDVTADATILALGGGSWGRLGSDGAWTNVLGEKGVAIARLKPSNCGFDVGWSEHFRERFAGAPVKFVALVMDGGRRQGEFVVTDTGVEGGLVYGLSAQARDDIAARGQAEMRVDLRPDRAQDKLAQDLARPRGKNSLANHLRRNAGLDGVKAGLLRELLPPEDFNDPKRLAAAIKALPIPLRAARPIDEAISTAGGVSFEGLDSHLMLETMPGVFCAGEMLDWDAPTGGYLLTACFASGYAAGEGVSAWLNTKS